MTVSLVPCPSCGRHVRQPESTCPFCGEATAATATSRATTRPLTRLALLLAGAAAVAACGKEPTTVDPKPAPPDHDLRSAPAYGAPPPFVLADGAVTTSPPPEPAPAPAKDAGTKK